MHTTAGVFLLAGEAGDVTPRYHLCSLHLTAFNTESSTPPNRPRVLVLAGLAAGFKKCVLSNLFHIISRHSLIQRQFNATSIIQHDLARLSSGINRLPLLPISCINQVW